MKYPRKKDYPKAICVAEGVWYTIHWKRNMGGNYMGLCWFETKEIWIKLGMSPKDTLETFEHEKMHAQAYEWDFDLNHPAIEKLEQPNAFFQAHNCGWIQWEK